MIYISVALATYVLFYCKKYDTKNKFNFDLKRQNHWSNHISIWAVIILVVLAGFRTSSVGYDLRNYESNFKAINYHRDIRLGHSFEYFFQILNLLCAYVGGELFGFNLLLIITALIELFCVLYCAKKVSPDIALTMFLYITLGVYLKAFDQVRQGIAIALLMVSVVFALEKKPWHFLTS